jgi:hypothetical protein
MLKIWKINKKIFPFRTMLKHLAKNKSDRIKLYKKELKPKEFVIAMEQKWQQDCHMAEEGAVAGRTRSRSRHCQQEHCRQRCCM